MNLFSVRVRATRLVVGAAVLLGAVALLSGDVGASGATARALLRTALDNAISSHWVHESVQVKQKGVVVQEASDDIGTTEGLQFVSSLGGGESQVVAFDRLQTLYVRANTLGLTSIYALSSTDAATYANEWMTLTPSNSEYGSIAYGTTLASDFGQVRFTGGVAESGVMTFKGRRVRALRGTVPPLDGAPTFAGTLYVTATGKPRPVTFVERNAKATVTVSWSSWGHRYVLHAPTGAVTFPTS
ncbi:MAG: hypothetical protein JWM55_188 [Acidimicrobiaceae bacterium]|nr:hypothetical protein [Acidimicrobiaceae bacterium]